MTTIRSKYLMAEPWIGLWISFLAICLVAATVYLIQGTIPYPNPIYFGDHHYYIAMAEKPFGSDPLVRFSPYAWRFLTPLVVFLLPLPIKAGFFLVSFVGLVFASYFLYLYLKDLKFELKYRLYGLLLFSTLYHAVAFNLWDFYLTDPLALAAFPLAFLMLHRRRYFILSLVLLISVLNKEAILLLGPTFLCIMVTTEKRYSWIRNTSTIVSCFLPAVIALILIRLLIEPVNGQSQLEDLFQPSRFEGGPMIVFEELARWSFLTWGVIASLFLVNPIRRIRQTIFMHPWIALFFCSIALQLLVAGNTERLLVYAFPVMIPMGLATIAYLSRVLKVREDRLMISLIIPHLILFFAKTTKGIDTSDWAMIASALLLVLVLAVLTTVTTLRLHPSIGSSIDRPNPSPSRGCPYDF